jgi:hypothetical protein
MQVAMGAQGSVTRLIIDLRSDDPRVREVAARLVWGRYFQELLSLARNNLSARISSREDEEDVLQSMYKSFCLRQRRGDFDTQEHLQQHGHDPERSLAALGAIVVRGRERFCWMGSAFFDGGDLVLAFAPWLSETLRLQLGTMHFLGYVHHGRANLSLVQPAAELADLQRERSELATQLQRAQGRYVTRITRRW